MTKTYISLGLVLLAAFEFYTAMGVFGAKNGAGTWTKTLMRFHRVCGYVFVVYFAWISLVCVDMMERLYTTGGYNLDARGFSHAALAMALFTILLLKISFVRKYQKYGPYVQLLGIIVAVGTVILWGMSGWMFLILTAYGRAVPAS